LPRKRLRRNESLKKKRKKDFRRSRRISVLQLRPSLILRKLRKRKKLLH
jgi:hypothetical protein